jgi:uridine phosphorylase
VKRSSIETVLRARGCAYIVSKRWTTDACYREAPAKIRRRKAEGCLAVEMEAAALFAMAEVRGVQRAQLLYGGDDVSGGTWDSRHWTAHAGREQLFGLAAEACLAS